MIRSLPVGLIGWPLLAVSAIVAQPATSSDSDSAVETPASSSGTTLPRVPDGISTIVGGTIRNLDFVRDQFSLALYNQSPMKILFDERTQVYRDGVKIPLRDLRPELHASVQTTLDGSDIFAVSIHVLSQLPEGECSGRVLKFNPQSGELEVSTALSPEPVKLIVPAEASVSRQGQSAFTSKSSGRNDLVTGALVSATFQRNQDGKDVASQVTIQATPGSSFRFAGTISYLDLSSGVLSLDNPQDGRNYEIHFASASETNAEKLHLGENVSVKATFDGSKYQAAEITAR